MEQLTSDMALLRFDPKLRPVKDVKRQLVDFDTMEHSATKVVVKEMVTLTKRFSRLSVEGRDNEAGEGIIEGENPVSDNLVGQPVPVFRMMARARCRSITVRTTTSSSEGT